MATTSRGRRERARRHIAQATDSRAIETLAQIVEARAAPGARAAHLADVLDGARTVADAAVDVAFIGGVAEADQHG